MKKIVLYSSKTGFTETYARWIAKELGCETAAWSTAISKRLTDYDVIIYGGSIMAGQIKKIKKVKSSIGGTSKKLVVFAVGATSPDKTEQVAKIKGDNFTEQEQKEIPFFYFQGGLNFEKMGFFSRKLLKMMANSVAKKENPTPEEQEMLATFSKSSDNSNPKAIIPLLVRVNELTN